MNKMFEEMMKGLGGGTSGPADVNNPENPFLKACQQMFKEFDEAKKDESIP